MKKLPILLLLIASSVHADTSVLDTISSDAIWTPAEGVYILENFVVIPNGVTLTIKPGTIIKVRSGQGMLEVYGTLVTNGDSTNKIYFTSTRDDSVGGDTNGDGIASLPSATDWNGIIFHEGSVGDISHTIIRYSGASIGPTGPTGSGRSAIFNLGGAVSMDDISFFDNYQSDVYQSAGSLTANKTGFHNQQYGIIFEGGTGLISQSSFGSLGIASNGIDNRSGVIIDARNNWWGSENGPRTSDNQAGTHAAVLGPVLYIPWLISDPTLELPPEQNIDPVIIIPGIMGSAYKNGELVIDPILHTYDDLIATLDANGYTPDVDLFTFPYEWRDSNVFTANLLDNKVDQVKSMCECNKVDIVAHSMGGLVARSYIQSVNYDGDVDQLIFLGTPHRGTPIDYLTWEAGQSDTDVRSQIASTFFQAEALRNSYSTIFSYIHNRPILSVQELLPVFNYLKDDDTGTIREYPNNYPQNNFLENLNNNSPNLLSSGVKITNIVGDSGENKTINVIRVIPTVHAIFWQHGEPDGFGAIFGDGGLERGTGDNTVTQFGSILEGVTNEEITASHNRIPTIAENRIFEILTGKESETNIDSGINISSKVLMLQLLSPIDMVITAPDGKKIGKNLSNSTEYNEIPLAFYSGFETDDEYVTILNPLDGEYKIEVQGTDSGGKYGVLTSYISEGFATTTETTGITGSNQVTNLEVVVSNQNPENLKAERQITLTVLINDIEGAYDLGWIKDKKTRNELIKKVQKIYKNAKKMDKNLAKALSLDFKLYRKEKINEQAYNLIKTDLEWLINN